VKPRATKPLHKASALVRIGRLFELLEAEGVSDRVVQMLSAAANCDLTAVELLTLLHQTEDDPEDDPHE